MWKSLFLLGAHNAKSALGRQASVLVYYAAAAGVAVFSVAFALIAVFAGLTTQFSPVASALILSLFLIAISAVLVSIGNYKRRQKAENTALMMGTIVAAPVVAKTFLRQPKVVGAVLVAAAVVGVLAGRSINRD